MGHDVYLKREDLLHTGAHKVNNALGQALLALRMGKRRIIAETGAGQHGVATATACALLGLQCVVYMGTEDMRRQKPNVERMGLLGATVGARGGRDRDAEGGVLGGDPRLDGQRRRRPTTSSAPRSGPAPYPALVRDLQRVIGDEARAQVLRARRAGCPTASSRAWAAGSNAIGTFTAFVPDAGVELVGVEAGGEGIDDRPPRRPALGGRAGRRPARLALGGHAGRRRADHRGALDLGRAGLPGLGTRARAPARLGPRALRGGHRRAGARGLPSLSQLEGIIPALESAHAIAWALENPAARSSTSCACRAAGTRTSPRCWRAWAEAIDRHRAHRRGLRGLGQARGAHALPHGRLPRPRDLARRSARPTPTAAPTWSSSACPFSDPLADGPVIQAAGTAALRAGADARRVLEVCAAAGAPRSRSCSCATPTWCWRAGPEPFADALADAGASGLIVPDLPLEEAPARARGLRRARARAGARWSPPPRPTSAWR